MILAGVGESYVPKPGASAVAVVYYTTVQLDEEEACLDGSPKPPEPTVGCEIHVRQSKSGLHILFYTVSLVTNCGTVHKDFSGSEDYISSY